MISVDLSLVVQIVLFLILWSILRRVLFGPVGRLMAERERRTEGAHAEARALSDEGKALQEQYDAAIAKARAEGEAIKGEIREEAQRARNVILSQGRDAATQKIQAIREEVRREMDAARAVASSNAEALAQEMAEKVLGRKLT
ncbi:MAG: ATP synthase F0 subunit B [Deltaproteobacteria bacterium]|nr:ATP synthase F0 subunit B [Deltaproteobacteria bacterium]